MILYYALGGGLGHLSRSLTLIEHAPEDLKSRMRILVSTKSAPAAKAHFPCPVDGVPGAAMSEMRRYREFLANYISRHDFTCIVLDTFPFGLLGELKAMAPRLSRVLVARYLKWEAYLTMCRSVSSAIWPEDAILIEEQGSAYRAMLQNNCFVVTARWPISPANSRDVPAVSRPPACCVIHSGTRAEIDVLTNLAKRVMADKGIPGTPEVFTPSRKIFPVERYPWFFSDIVTGAGYASCAAATLLDGRVRYHLHPFDRRFDDQHLRLARLKSGTWIDTSPGSAAQTASLLWDIARVHT